VKRLSRTLLAEGVDHVCWDCGFGPLWTCCGSLPGGRHQIHPRPSYEPELQAHMVTLCPGDRRGRWWYWPELAPASPHGDVVAAAKWVIPPLSLFLPRLNPYDRLDGFPGMRSDIGLPGHHQGDGPGGSPPNGGGLPENRLPDRLRGSGALSCMIFPGLFLW